MQSTWVDGPGIKNQCDSYHNRIIGVELIDTSEWLFKMVSLFKSTFKKLLPMFHGLQEAHDNCRKIRMHI